MKIADKVIYNGNEGTIYDITNDGKTVWVETSEDIYKTNIDNVTKVFTKLTEDIKDYITNIKNVNIDDSIEVAVLKASDIVSKYNLDSTNVNLHKLNRSEKELITGLDYSSDRITTDYVIQYHETDAITNILLDIIVANLEGKNINRLVNKWIID